MSINVKKLKLFNNIKTLNKEPKVKNVKSLLTNVKYLNVYLKPKLKKFFPLSSHKHLNKSPKYFSYRLRKRPRYIKKPLLIRAPKYIFSTLKKKYRKFRRRNAKKLAKKTELLLDIHVRRNPYILVRKNYQSIFSSFFNGRFITPLSFDFLHLAYFKLNKNKLYKPRAISRLDSYARRMYKFTLKNYKRFKLSPYQYLFTLMKKKTHYQKVSELYNTNHLYNLQLHQLYFFQKAKKYDFKSFIDCPEFLHPEMGDYPFNQNDALKFNEYKYLQKIMGLYYPVTELLFKETHIHGKPMKTKLPRRI